MLIHIAQSHSIIKSEILTPLNDDINGANIITNFQEVTTNHNNEWNVTVSSQNTWQFLLALDNTWGFHPHLPSTITFTIHPSTATTTHTFDDLLFGFTVNNRKYFSAWVPMHNSAQQNKIFPACDTSDTPTQPFHIGNIASLPNTNRVCDIADGSCSHWRPMQPINAQLNELPVTFTLENDPSTNTLNVYFKSEVHNTPFIQRCGFIALPTDSGLKVYISGNEPGHTFIISSFTVEYIVSSMDQTPISTQTDDDDEYELYDSDDDDSETSQTDMTSTRTYDDDSDDIYTSTLLPTKDRTIHPTPSPTRFPTAFPTLSPTITPTVFTTFPSKMQMHRSTYNPTVHPTSYPTPMPSSNPILITTALLPTRDPTVAPSSHPTTIPSVSPETHSSLDSLSVNTMDANVSTPNPINIESAAHSPPSLNINISAMLATTNKTSQYVTIWTESPFTVTSDSLKFKNLMLPITLGLVMGACAALCVMVAVIRQHMYRKNKTRIDVAVAPTVAQSKALSKEEAIAFRGHYKVESLTSLTSVEKLSKVSSTYSDSGAKSLYYEPMKWRSVDDESTMCSVDLSSIVDGNGKKDESMPYDSFTLYKKSFRSCNSYHSYQMTSLPEYISTSDDAVSTDTDTDDAIIPRPHMHCYDSITEISQCTEEKWHMPLGDDIQRTTRSGYHGITNTDFNKLHNAINHATTYSDFEKLETMIKNQEIPCANWNGKGVDVDRLDDSIS